MMTPLILAPTVLLLRVYPTDVSWGEISFTRGPSVEITTRGKPFTYGFTLKIECAERERIEHPEEPAAPPVEPARANGTVYLAAEMDGGREAWKRLVDGLTAHVATLTPATFPAFAREFRAFLIGPESVVEGGFRAVGCSTLDGESDQAWEGKQVVTEGQVETASTTFPDGRPLCASLSGALDHEPPTEILATPFEVRAQREESLDWYAVSGSPERPVVWPAGAGIDFNEAPEGATAYSSSGRDQEGGAWAEELRPGETPGVVRSHAQAGPIPLEALDGDALLTRFTFSVRQLVLGTDPETSVLSSEPLDVGFFFTEPHGPVDEEDYAHAVAREFADSDDRPGLALLSRSLEQRLTDLGTDAMFVVFCEPGAERYCVARACVPIENAERFCGALAARLD